MRPTIVATVAAILLMSGCAAEPEPQPTVTRAATTRPTTVAPTPTPTPTASPAPTPAASRAAYELSCDTLLDSYISSGFAGEGLVAEPKDFGFADIPALPGGLACAWGHPDQVGTEAHHLFGWAPMTPALAAEVLAAAESSAQYAVEVGLDGTFIVSADPAAGPNAFAYFLTDSSLRFADDREKLGQIAYVP